LGSGKIDEILEIKLDGSGFFNFFQGGEIEVAAVGEGDRMRGDGGGQDNFSVG